MRSASSKNSSDPGRAEAPGSSSGSQTVRGLAHYTLFAIDIAARCVHVAGTTTNPSSAWMEQIARKLTVCDEGFLIGKRLLIVE